jgi:hypothetical protein
VIFLIEYLGEFKFIFKTVLGYVTVGQMDSFEAKKRSRKSHAWAPLRQKNVGSSGGSLVATPDCKTAVLGSNPAISPAYSGLLS